MEVTLLAQSASTLDSKLADALILMLVGMSVVFTALILLWAVIVAVDRLTGAPAEPTRAEEAAPSEQPHLIAVLAAAATAALGRPARVQRVRFLGYETTAWRQEGRRLVMTSHHPHLHKRK